MKYGYAFLRGQNDCSEEQIASLLKAGCEKIYLERPRRRPRSPREPAVTLQPRLRRLLGLLSVGDILVVNDLRHLACSADKLTSIVATLGILDATLVSIADGIDTHEAGDDQIRATLAALDRHYPPDGKPLSDIQAACTQVMLTSSLRDF